MSGISKDSLTNSLISQCVISSLTHPNAKKELGSLTKKLEAKNLVQPQAFLKMALKIRQAAYAKDLI